MRIQLDTPSSPCMFNSNLFIYRTDKYMLGLRQPICHNRKKYLFTVPLIIPTLLPHKSLPARHDTFAVISSISSAHVLLTDDAEKTKIQQKHFRINCAQIYIFQHLIGQSDTYIPRYLYL